MHLQKFDASIFDSAIMRREIRFWVCKNCGTKRVRQLAMYEHAMQCGRDGGDGGADDEDFSA